MKFKLTTLQPSAQTNDCLIVGIYENQQLTPAAQAIDKTSDGFIKKILANQDFNGKAEQTLLLYNLPKISSPRVLLVGCGNPNDLNETQYLKIIYAAMSTLKGKGSKQVTHYLTELNIPKRNLHWKIRQLIECEGHLFYSFDQLKSNKDEKTALNQIAFYLPDEADQKQAEQAIEEANAICAGIKLYKDLANLPGNICTPTYLADQAQQLSKLYKQISTTILDKKQMEKLGMGALLAVASGSDQPPKLIIVEYDATKNKNDSKPVVLVGKGVTFDSGGISLKPPGAMDEMKFDMCGAATVLATIKAIAELGLPIHVIGVIPATENLPSGSATKPGDIVTTMSGQTVEILNTDAEGRLILCDALTYCERFNPDTVIDIATLTGAIVVALGTFPAGLFTQNEELSKELMLASEQSYDRLWRMPLWDDYQAGLESNFADFANISSDRGAGSTSAACFMARFTKKYPWAHLDIAGIAYRSGKEKGATGRPVPLLVQFLLNRTHRIRNFNHDPI